jgi:phosphate transport system permease protein
VKDRSARRRLVDRAVRGACLVATLLALVPLFSLLGFILVRGIGGLSLAFFQELPRPVGEPGGGMAHALVGSLAVVGLAALLAVPAGVLAGVHLAEFRGTRFVRFVRFSADVMAGVPSIIVGLFVYALVVVTTRSFSAWAGALALAVLMLPTIARSTEELMLLVPESLREAALGLGVPKWRATLRIVLRTAAPGIVTGVMLAVARALGETAPLLFTAFNNREWADGLGGPIATLPVNIYAYAVSPYADWHAQAWAAALVLVTLVLFLNVGARLLSRGRVRVR